MRHERRIHRASERNGPVKFKMEIAPSRRNMHAAHEEVQDLGEIVEEANEALKGVEEMNVLEEPWKQPIPGLGPPNDFQGEFGNFSQLQQLAETIDANSQALRPLPVPMACTSEMDCGQKSQLDSTLQNAIPILQKISDAFQANRDLAETTEAPVSRNGNFLMP